MELLLFLIMPFFVETVMPERTCVAVCLMVPFAVYALEGMGTGLSFISSLGVLVFKFSVVSMVADDFSIILAH